MNIGAIGVPKKDEDKMRTKMESLPEGRPRVLSADLSAVVGERALVRLVLDAVQTIDPKVLIQAGGKPPEFRPQMMLSLLTYCYAVRLYGSEDIEAAMGIDRMVTYLCARTYPDWQSIRRFRRQHRDLLTSCLEYVFKQVWAVQFDQGEADYVGYEWFEAEFLQEVRDAVKERLDTATLMDGAESGY